MARRSDYTYHINREQGQPVLVIIDRGGMSITNNVEAVVQSIAAEVGEQVRLMPAIYRDSTGRFDGIRVERVLSGEGGSPFYSLAKHDEASAVAAVIARVARKDEIDCQGRRGVSG